MRALAVTLAKLRLKDMTGAECKVLLRALREHALDLLIEEMQTDADRDSGSVAGDTQACEARATSAAQTEA